ncbi:YfiR family protein [Massilia sp. MB5]|uniref:YfiR family protein n=1 Tax=Massilia sp. MB5 TaxID=2919578 RepID=UPI001F0D167D|nr:YfiR family protein [Massilia sp. MB5]UMR31298.1 YfiR family protein [Massilia sp. MB5]
MAFLNSVRFLAARLHRDRCLLLILAVAHGFALGQGSVALERQVKAAYLCKFAGFVEWPEGSFARPDSPLLIGVAGAEALAAELEQSMAGHAVNGHALQVRRLKKGETPAGLHILFAGAALERNELQDLLAAARGQAILTISDAEEAQALGSVIRFLVIDDRLRFEVALKAAGLSRLRISARMLAAAYKVRQVNS